jgi:hypothetical protein
LTCLATLTKNEFTKNVRDCCCTLNSILLIIFLPLFFYYTVLVIVAFKSENVKRPTLFLIFKLGTIWNNIIFALLSPLCFQMNFRDRLSNFEKCKDRNWIESEDQFREYSHLNNTMPSKPCAWMYVCLVFFFNFLNFFQWCFVVFKAWVWHLFCQMYFWCYFYRQTSFFGVSITDA